MDDQEPQRPQGRPGPGSPVVGFMMDMVAGHVTNYRNLRAVVEEGSPFRPVWHEVSSYRPEGRLERLRARVPVVPSYLTGNLRAASELRAGLRAGPYDAVFSNVRAGVFFARRFRGVPTLIDFDVTPLQLDAMPAYGVSHDPKPLADLKFRLSRSMFQAATVLHAWTNWAKRGVVEGYGVDPERVVVNPPGVDLDLWRPAPPVESDVRRVLFVGGDFARKGGDVLLRWHRSHGAGTELHLVTRDPVEAGPGVVVHRGLTANSPELRELYDRAHVFVMPSLGECFGIATVEAMAAGLPVVTTDVGGTADIVEPGGNGHIVPAGDVTAFGAAVEAILGDDARRRAMAARSRQLAEERFDVRRNARRTIDLLAALASGRYPAAGDGLVPTTEAVPRP